LKRRNNRKNTWNVGGR